MYADDIVLMAEKEQDMRSLISRMEGYLDKKRLELNIEKTKMIRFRKGEGRKKKIDWRWKGKGIEEVRETKYLGHVNEKWRPRSTYKEKKEESSDERNIGDRKDNMGKRLGKKNVTI